jgi:hypothetical protein
LPGGEVTGEFGVGFEAVNDLCDVHGGTFGAVVARLNITSVVGKCKRGFCLLEDVTLL